MLGSDYLIVGLSKFQMLKWCSMVFRTQYLPISFSCKVVHQWVDGPLRMVNRVMKFGRKHTDYFCRVCYIVVAWGSLVPHKHCSRKTRRNRSFITCIAFTYCSSRRLAIPCTFLLMSKNVFLPFLNKCNNNNLNFWSCSFSTFWVK